jgi:hypothetical protein
MIPRIVRPSHSSCVYSFIPVFGGIFAESSVYHDPRFADCPRTVDWLQPPPWSCNLGHPRSPFESDCDSLGRRADEKEVFLLVHRARGILVNRRLQQPAIYQARSSLPDTLPSTCCNPLDSPRFPAVVLQHSCAARSCVRAGSLRPLCKEPASAALHSNSG